VPQRDGGWCVGERARGPRWAHLRSASRPRPTFDSTWLRSRAETQERKIPLVAVVHARGLDENKISCYIPRFNDNNNND
jgi:hypothetical protein